MFEQIIRLWWRASENQHQKRRSSNWYTCKTTAIHFNARQNKGARIVVKRAACARLTGLGISIVAPREAVLKEAEAQ